MTLVKDGHISVTFDEHSTWTLNIREVDENDQGCYLCMVNTKKIIKQAGCIDVLGEKSRISSS